MLLTWLTAWTLAVACANHTPRVTLGVVDSSPYHGHCHSEAKGDAIRKLVLQVGACRFTPPCDPLLPPPVTGFMTKLELKLPEVQTPPGLEKYNFYIPDKCYLMGKEMAGTVIHACDQDVAPTLMVTGSGVGYACIHRHGLMYNTAHIYIHQYCL